MNCTVPLLFKTPPPPQQKYPLLNKNFAPLHFKVLSLKLNTNFASPLIKRYPLLHSPQQKYPLQKNIMYPNFGTKAPVY